MTLGPENDARLACLGEWKYGAGQQSSDMVMVTLGTGYGTSAIINGQILRGKHFQAGILGGHFVIDFTNKDRNQQLRQVWLCGSSGFYLDDQRRGPQKSCLKRVA